MKKRSFQNNVAVWNDVFRYFTVAFTLCGMHGWRG